MEYWNTEITQKSWNVLQKIRKNINFILIGGWATYLWAKSHKSKDIDTVVDYNELNKLKLNYNLNKNDSLKKYEIKVDDIDIDVYVPFYSKLPLLENIQKYTTTIEGFNVVKLEMLLILKQSAEIDRGFTEKGLKDRIDILNLILKCNINFGLYRSLLYKENLGHLKKRLVYIISTFKDTKYLDLSPREFRLKKEEIIKNLNA